jgi:RNA polymerase sigma-70 factor (ECF subfamily)
LDETLTLTFESFFLGQYPLVYRAVLAFCGDRELAADATQEAFVRAYGRWNRIGKEPWAGGWTTTTALNLCKRMGRKASRRRAIESAGGGQNVGSGNEDWYSVHEALARLPHRQRQVIVLHYFCDCPISEVAQLIHTSEGTVKAHLFKARRALGQNLATQEFHLKEEVDGA